MRIDFYFGSAPLLDMISFIYIIHTHKKQKIIKMKLSSCLKLGTLSALALGVLFTSALAASSTTAIADEKIEFNQISQKFSVNCSAAAQAALTKNPLFVTFVVSENSAMIAGFADLLLASETFSSPDSTPQIVLYNEGIQGHLDLIGAGTQDSSGDLDIAMPVGGEVFYLNEAFTDDITPTTGNEGSAELILSLNPASSASAMCVVKGQVVSSMPFNE